MGAGSKALYVASFFKARCNAASDAALQIVIPYGDDRSVKIKSLERGGCKIMKIKWLVLGCTEAKFCK